MIELVDPFFPAIIAVASIVLLVGACMFWLGLDIGKDRANRNIGKRIVDAFDDGHKQGLREAAPHRDTHGRFTS